MIQDPRIGRRGPKGRIVQVPTKYVSGEGYTPAANPAPTIFWIDKEGEYFVILPVSMSRINLETHAMLLKLVGKENQIDFPYNHGDDDDDGPYAANTSNIISDKKEVEADDEEPAQPKKVVKVVDQSKFQLPSFNKKVQSVSIEADDEDDEPSQSAQPKTREGLGLVSKTANPKPLKSTLDNSGVDPKKPNVVN